MGTENKCLEWWPRESRAGLDKLWRDTEDSFVHGWMLGLWKPICEAENVKKETKDF